jgi:hypothetical protein
MYNARKDVAKITTRTNQLKIEHFADFEKCYHKRKESELFKSYTLAEIKEKMGSITFAR